MEFQEFIVYVFLSLLGVIVVLGILNLIYNTKIVKRFSGKFVKILANYELQSEDLSSLFTATFFNNNMADIKVHSFGFMYCNEQVDFYEEYVKANHPDLTKRMVIEPTESVKLQVSYDRMKKMLLAIRTSRSSLQPIYGYIIDSNGNQTTVKLKDIFKNVKRIFKVELKEESLERKEAIKKAKQVKKEKKNEQKAEQRNIRKIKRSEQKHKRIEKRGILKEKWKQSWTNFKTKVRNIFKRKPKADNKKESD